MSIALRGILPRLDQLVQETSDASIAEIRRAICPADGEVPRRVLESGMNRCGEAEPPSDSPSRVGGLLEECAGERLRDLLNTRLMEVFKNHRSETAFALLYDLNQRLFFYTIYSRTRRYCYLLDTADILQEVFLNIYRYPHRFKSEKATSFRNWTNTIIRNTVLKNLKTQARHARTESYGEDFAEQRDFRAISPLRSAMHEENRADTCRSYLICLHLYLQMYNHLSSKERRALELVEVRGASYREASEVLAIRLENLKMVIFRARKKIYRSMRKVLSHAG